jgi:hypothetical protein
MLSRLYNGPGVCAGTAPRADHLPGLAIPAPADRADLPLDAGSARWYGTVPGNPRSWRCALSFPTKPTWIGATLGRQYSFFGPATHLKINNDGGSDERR